MKNVYDVTNELENQIAKYTGAPYAVCVDNASNAIFLSLYYENHIKNRIKNKTVTCFLKKINFHFQFQLS